MDKELLMLYGARHAVLQILDKGSCSFAKRLDDGTWQTVDWVDICNYLTEMIDKYKADRSVKDGEEEIRVGDEVLSDIGISSSKGLVLGICNSGIKILWQDLRCTIWTYEGAKSIKTGRNFPQIAEVLKQMKEPQESEDKI